MSTAYITSPRSIARHEMIHLVQHALEPQLARLMHDDEQQLVGMLGHHARTLQREQLVEREIGPVRHGVDDVRSS